jgi:hypothetical protein
MAHAADEVKKPLSPSSIVLKSFTQGKPLKLDTPFPRLHPTVEEERKRSYSQQAARRPPPMIAIPPLTTRWFPEQPAAPTLGKVLAPNLPQSLSSPRSQLRVQRRREHLAQIRITLDNQVSPNLTPFIAALTADMDDNGELSAVQFTRAFQELDVSDISILDSFFTLVDLRGRGVVPVKDIIAAIDIAINKAPERIQVRRASFEPFNLDGRGYIHKSKLDEYKFFKDPVEHGKESVITPHMVKALSDVFINIGVEEEEKFLATLSKGKKKPKKAPPLKPTQKSIIPINMMRQSHMDFNYFSNFFDTSKELAAAFTKCWLPLTETNAALRLSVLQRLEDLQPE